MGYLFVLFAVLGNVLLYGSIGAIACVIYNLLYRRMMHR